MIETPTLLGPALLWNQKNYQEFIKRMGYFTPSWAMILSRGKADVKMNESSKSGPPHHHNLQVNLNNSLVIIWQTQFQNTQPF